MIWECLRVKNVFDYVVCSGLLAHCRHTSKKLAGDTLETPARSYSLKAQSGLRLWLGLGN